MIGPEADQAAFINRFGGRLPCFALGFEREIDLHDRVLLHEAHQHDQADKRINIELDLKHDQRQQRAHAGRREGPKES